MASHGRPKVDGVTTGRGRTGDLIGSPSPLVRAGPKIARSQSGCVICLSGANLPIVCKIVSL